MELDLPSVTLSCNLLPVRIPLQHGHVTIISVDAPTLDADDDVKESFYGSLRTVLSAVPQCCH